MKAGIFKMLCLDTYALWEISKGNPKFMHLMDKDIIVPDTTLAEFYCVLLLEYDKPTADYWYKQISPYTKSIDKLMMVKAMNYKYQNKKKRLSFLDCVGYLYAMENNYKFVTGDKGFEDMRNVLFIKK
ncbi:hypothetical protein GF323_02625 [Candidatus Woesearchaeota archaeon]|nr:hypothetical protein [Candidatus Woesearchaeota archaeon]